MNGSILPVRWLMEAKHVIQNSRTEFPAPRKKIHIGSGRDRVLMTASYSVVVVRFVPTCGNGFQRLKLRSIRSAIWHRKC